MQKRSDWEEVDAVRWMRDADPYKLGILSGAKKEQILTVWTSFLKTMARLGGAHRKIECRTQRRTEGRPIRYRFRAGLKSEVRFTVDAGSFSEAMGHFVRYAERVASPLVTVRT